MEGLTHASLAPVIAPAELAVRRHAARGFNIRYLHRVDDELDAVSDAGGGRSAVPAQHPAVDRDPGGPVLPRGRRGPRPRGPATDQARRRTGEARDLELGLCGGGVADEPLEFDDIPSVEKVHTMLYREVNDNPDDDFYPGTVNGRA